VLKKKDLKRESCLEVVQWSFQHWNTCLLIFCQVLSAVLCQRYTLEIHVRKAEINIFESESNIYAWVDVYNDS